MSTKRDEQAVAYARKLLSLARASAQISGAVNPADWVIACIEEAVDNAAARAGVTLEVSEKLLIVVLKARYKQCATAIEEAEATEGPAKWIVDDLFNRVFKRK